MSKVNKAGPELSKDQRRLLKLLTKKKSSGIPCENSDNRVMLFLQARTYTFTFETIRALVKHRLVSETPTKLMITSLGLEVLRQSLGLEFEPVLQTRATENRILDEGATKVLVNQDESPLYRLYRRKTKLGTNYLSNDEYEAGERLRRDFERAQLQPKITASYEASAGQVGKGGHFHAHEISDLAIDARKRLDHANRLLGPELSSLALDICCFLKGMESVERERSWPPRSAKLMLKTALQLLSRHYGFSGFEKQTQRTSSTWHTSDYRPQMRSG